jgi:spermidine/putrescine-binding protein
MNQHDFNRRVFLKGLASASALAAAGGVPKLWAQGEELSLWCPPIAKPTETWEPIEQRAGVKIKWSPKSADAQQAITKMLAGDGQRLYDVFTDNGGGMEDAMSENGVIVPIDRKRLKNWNLLRDEVRNDDGPAAHSIRSKGTLYAIPYLSNADSLAYLPDKLNFTPDSWEPLFDSQFKGRVAMQDDFGPTLTNTAIYLKGSGKVEIKDPSNMEPNEVKAVCQFLIDKKKQGQFRTFWNGFQQSVDLLVSQEVVMMSCWEPQVYVSRRKGVFVEYGTMKEGHQVWNNIVMLSKGGKQRGKEAAYYRLCDVFLSPWYCASQMAKFGFASMTTGVLEYAKANPAEFDVKHFEDVIRKKNERYAVKGNAWQNVYPTHLEAYQEWWSRVQAA